MRSEDLEDKKRLGSPAPLRSWLGLLATLGPVLVVAMDGSILFLAIPHIAEALQPSAAQSLWVLDIYGFVVGSLLITFGKVGDRFGRRKLLLAGAGLFGIGSACGAFSPTVELLIASRALMGLGGATLLPSCLAVISELFKLPAQRARAIGIFAATFAAGFVIGPIVGGLLLGRFAWGSVFLINIPIIVIFLAAAPFLFSEVHGTRPGAVDLPSVVISALGILSAVHGTKQLAAQGWSWPQAGLALLGIGLMTVFVFRQRRLADPLLDIDLFTERVFAVAVLTGLLSLFVWSATAYLSMVYLQTVLGYPVLHAALLAVPGAVVLTLSSVFTPRLAARIGARAALLLCHFSMAMGVGVLTLTGSATGPALYVASTVVAGVGFGISFSLVAETAVGAVPEARAGAAGAIAETSNEIGNALGIALLGSLLTVVFRASYPGTEASVAEALGSGSHTDAEIANAREAFLFGFHVVALVAAGLCAALGVLASRWIPKAGNSQPRRSKGRVNPPHSRA